MAPSSTLITKLKVQLKLSITRLRNTQQKDEAIAKQQRRAMAQLLEIGKEESARIRVENIIRSELTTELHEILELYCELLLARVGLMEPKECDPGLEEAIKSIIYAAPRTEVKELQQVRMLLVEKYGKEFGLAATDNSDGMVAERVLKKLKVEPPPRELVTEYLTIIAESYKIDWPKGRLSKEQEPPEFEESDGEGGGGLEEPLTTQELNKATPPQDFGPRSPVSIAPPNPTTDNRSPKVKLPALDFKAKIGAKKADGEASSNKTAVGGKIPDVDELAARFAALKKR